MSELVGEKAASSYLRQGSGTTVDSSVTPEERSSSEEVLEEQHKISVMKQYPKPVHVETKDGNKDGPSVRAGDGNLKAISSKVVSKDKKALKPTSIPAVPKLELSKFSDELETKFRVGTYHGCPVYGAVLNQETGVYDYLGETELHLVWDVDQSKLVGEGTNDVELVLKCVLWWKEELQHDDFFIPAQVIGMSSDLLPLKTGLCLEDSVLRLTDSPRPLNLKPFRVSP